MTVPTAGIGELLADLLEERALLERMLEPLADQTWWAAQPGGWAIGDHVTRLAFFDEAAATALTAPERFATHSQARRDQTAGELVDGYRARPGAELLAWLRRAQGGLVGAYDEVDPERRVPWYGTELAAGTALAARLLETWAHGWDIADVLGCRWEPTDRLRHVADLGVRSLGTSFEVLGRPVPTVPVRIELTAPSGVRWTWGRVDARDRVRGSAEDLCLVLTRRRELSRVALEVTGAVAGEWLAIASPYPGAPYPGPSDGSASDVRGRRGVASSLR